MSEPTTPPRALVTSSELSMDAAVRAVSHAGAGAIVTFAGTVRDTNDGRAVSKLEYEAYASMAEAEIGRIARDIEAEIPGVRVSVQHRTGALGVGDIAVVCAASAPHRSEAFRACRLAIDRVKESVPIWKRERREDGSAVWIDPSGHPAAAGPA